MIKEEKEYQEKYGDVPEDERGRFEYLVKSIHYRNAKESVLKKVISTRNIKWKTQKFVLYWLPKGTPRPRLGKGNVFYVKNAKKNKERFYKFLKDSEWELVTTPCVFEVRSYFPIPEAMKKPEKLLSEMGLIRPISTPDWDNIGKTYSDMIQDIVLYNDSLIIDGISRKYYSVKPRVEIYIRYMESFDSDFNRKKIEKQLKKGNELI